MYVCDTIHINIIYYLQLQLFTIIINETHNNDYWVSKDICYLPFSIPLSYVFITMTHSGRKEKDLQMQQQIGNCKVHRGTPTHFIPLNSPHPGALWVVWGSPWQGINHKVST